LRLRRAPRFGGPAENFIIIKLSIADQKISATTEAMVEARFPILLFAAGLLAGVGAIASEPSEAKSAQEPVLKRFHLRVGVGAAYRSFGDLSFDTHAHSSPSALPRLFTSEASGGPYGPRSGFADRRYDDGFVFRDVNTENPGSFLPGTTAFFGYQSNSQVQGGALLFHGTGAASTFSSRSDARGGWTDDHNASAAPVLQVCLDYPLTPTVEVGGAFGFMFASIASENSATTFQGLYQPRAVSVTDRYALGGLILPLAPYAGQFNPNGPAPLINNVPSGRSESSRDIPDSKTEFSNQVHESLDLNFYTFSLGPTIRFHREKIAASLSAGAAFNVADWEAKYSERLVSHNSDGRRREVRHWRAGNSGTDFLPGFFVQSEVGYNISSCCAISVFGRYDWTESLHGAVDNSSFSFNLSGFTVGGAVNFTF
jgi:hypothetical protein